jgi:hypothetical protein
MPSSLSPAAFEAVVSNLTASYYLTAAAIVILLYDYILTLSDGEPASVLQFTLWSSE